MSTEQQYLVNNFSGEWDFFADFTLLAESPQTTVLDLMYLWKAYNDDSEYVYGLSDKRFEAFVAVPEIIAERYGLPMPKVER